MTVWTFGRKQTKHNPFYEGVPTGAANDTGNVIVTVPIGVLKANTIAFNPPLPAWKSKAIERMGVGVVEKIALKFEKAFWRPSAQTPRSVFYVADELGDFPAFIDSSRSAECPMLVAFLTGDQVSRMAEDSEPFVERATVPTNQRPRPLRWRSNLPRTRRLRRRRNWFRHPRSAPHFGA